MVPQQTPSSLRCAGDPARVAGDLAGRESALESGWWPPKMKLDALEAVVILLAVVPESVPVHAVHQLGPLQLGPLARKRQHRPEAAGGARAFGAFHDALKTPASSLEALVLPHGQAFCASEA